MKPGKTRLARRAQHDRLASAGFELERTANRFKEVQLESPACVRSARLELYRAALAFAATVDGEEAEQAPAKAAHMKAVK